MNANSQYYSTQYALAFRTPIRRFSLSRKRPCWVFSGQRTDRDQLSLILSNCSLLPSSVLAHTIKHASIYSWCSSIWLFPVECCERLILFKFLDSVPFKYYPYIILKVRLGCCCQDSLHNLKVTPVWSPHQGWETILQWELLDRATLSLTFCIDV